MSNSDSYRAMQLKQRLKASSKFKTLFILIFGVIFVYSFSLAYGPNQQLHLHRTIPSQLDPQRIERNIASPTRWSQWFFSLSEAKLIHSSSLEKGAILQLEMNPNKGERKKFTLVAKVTDYIPGRLLQLQIVEDSTGRLTRLFDALEWRIEIEPQQSGSLIRGTAIAQTRHWRSRMFGGIAERILMNQVFYPNLMKLSQLRQPFSVDVPEAPKMGF